MVEAQERDGLEQGRAAVDRRSWPLAYEHLSSVDAASELAPEDLELLAKAAWWVGRPGECIEARERAYAAYVERGERGRAAFVALTLRRDHTAKMSPSVAAGWLQRAERLLEGAAESPVKGYLELALGEVARGRGDLDEAERRFALGAEIAHRHGDMDLNAWASMRQGALLVDTGRVEEGWALMEGVSAAAAGGELGAYTTGAAFCNVISLCRDLADVRRGAEWADAAKRWCERQEIAGFPGICRVHRAEILRLLGSLPEADTEVRRAFDELREFHPAYAASAIHELGEVRLRLGDLDGAGDAFRQAHELGEDPQPGLSLLLLAQGKGAAAAASIARSLEEVGPSSPLERARLLPAMAEIALANQDLEAARAASEELASTSSTFGTPSLRAGAAWADGVSALLEGDHERAGRALRGAARFWTELDVPYEAAKARVLLARAYEAAGDLEAARMELGTARRTFERLGATLDADRTRRATEAEPRTALRTFLFTDVVGSTSLIEAIGDPAWDDLRRWHDETLRSCFAAHGGEEVDHAGDGFFVAFPDPRAAIGCAIQIQRRLAEHRREHGFAPQVRIGVHAAEALGSGDTYVGAGVHAAARIGALAGGGEIVASRETTRDLEDVRYSEPRRTSLKGIAEPVEVVTVDWD